jgi:hypothetical protein
MPKGYFSDFTWGKFFLYFVAAVYVLGAGIMSILEPFLELPCDDTQKTVQFPNPAFPARACPDTRYLVLLGFSPSECACARRLVASVLLGGLIGWERRQADRYVVITKVELASMNPQIDSDHAVPTQSGRYSHHESCLAGIVSLYD